MKARLLGCLVLAVSLGGCGAEPSEVCSHIKEIATKEVGPDGAVEAGKTCEAQWNRRRDHVGLIKYRELSGCVMDASDLESLAQCE